jgi:hypothetical protein
MNGEGLEGGGLTGAAGVVKRGEIAGEQRKRPTIGGDVVMVEQQNVLILGELQQAGAKQQAGAEVKGCGGFLIQPGVDQRLGIAPIQGFGPEGEGGGRMQELHHLIPHQVEGGAQGGMALDQCREGLLQGGDVEITLEPPEEGQVISAELRFELVQEPEARLGKRGLERLAPRGPIAGEGLSGGDGLASGGGLGAVLVWDDQGNQTGDAGALKQRCQGGSGAKGLLDAGDQSGGGEGMATDQEEVVGDAEVAVAEHLGPEVMQLAFEFVGGRDALLQISCERGSRQGLAIELAVGGEGQGLQGDEGRGDHVVR